MNLSKLSDKNLKVVLRPMTYNKKYVLFIIFFYFFIFKDPLENSISFFAYSDEVIALLAVPLFFVDLVSNRFVLKKDKYGYARYLIIFLICGLLGGVVYAYQPLYCVILDAFLNLKFWFAIYVGIFAFRNFSLKDNAAGIYFHCKLITILFLGLFVIDNVAGGVFNASIRYGLRSTQLFYFIPTTFAAACALIVCVLISIKKHVAYSNVYIAILLFLLCSTLRMKAIASAVAFMLILYIVFKFKKKINIWMIVSIGLLAVAIGWEQIEFYFFSDIQNDSARYQLLITSIKVANDHFPFGSGFSTYASAYSSISYSPLYFIYNLSGVNGLQESNPMFVSDSFWPMILGQTGWIGLIMYILALLCLFKKIQSLRTVSACKYASALCILCYLLISSTSEAAFVHPIAIPLAIWLGYLLSNKGDIYRKV